MADYLNIHFAQVLIGVGAMVWLYAYATTAADDTEPAGDAATARVDEGECEGEGEGTGISGISGISLASNIVEKYKHM